MNMFMPILMDQSTGDFSSIKTTLAGICGALGVLATLAALMLYGMGKVSSDQGARGEGAMMGCIAAAVAFYAAAAFISTANLSFSVPTASTSG